MSVRLFLVCLCLLLFIGVIFIFGTAINEEYQDLPVANSSSKRTPSIPIERGVFSRSSQALMYQQMPESERSLNTYYDNRAYAGAPPMIPHPLISEKGIGGKTCLQCHQNGGYTDQFKAFAPVTPHPEFSNCKQCHLPQKTKQIFKTSDWQKELPPTIHQAALEGAPPMIPHSLHLRNNCLSCHAGPGAAKEIRVSHPERVNCQQCHLPINTQQEFSKPNTPKSLSQMIINEKPLNQIKMNQLSAWVRQNKKNTNDE